MKNPSTRRPSAAMIVAIAALSFALVGSAAAGTGALEGAKALGVTKVKKIANKQITKRAPGLSVATAKVADSAGKADTATTAERANNVHAAEVANGCASATAQTGGIEVTAIGGECNVVFPRSVKDCAITLGTLLDFPGGGETTYRKQGGGLVQVSRRDSAGGTPTAGAFSIAAICP